MDTFAALVARDRRSDAPACRVGTGSHVYDYRRFCTTAWKVGNFLTHRGVRGGATVGVVADPNPKALLTILGAGLLGARSWLSPPREFEGRAIVAPGAAVREYDLPVGGQPIAFGETPDDHDVTDWETEVWSENPTMPPERPPAETVAVTDGGVECTQSELLTAAANVVAAGRITDADTVVLRASLADPRGVAAALAPLAAGAELVFPGDEVVGDVGIGADAPEERVVDLAAATP